MSSAVPLGRRFATGAAVLYTTAFTAWMTLSGDWLGPDSIFESWPAAGLAAHVLVGACASSLIVIEILRIVSPKLRAWNDTRYALGVAYVAAPLLWLQVTLLILVLRRVR